MALGSRVLMCGLLLLGCSDGSSGPVDGSADATTDAGAADASPADAGSDGGGPDGASSDAGSDGGAWAACPSLDDYEGDVEWTHTMEVADDTVLCATFNESRTLKEELASKAMMRIAPGAYPIPSVAGSYTLGLPICMDLGDGNLGRTSTGDDALITSSASGRSSYDHRWNTTAGGATWTQPFQLEMHLSGADGDTVSIAVDGAGNDAFGEGGLASFSLCRAADECYTLDSRRFDSCTHPDSALQRHTVTFEGGTIELEMRIGESPASTEPGAFVRGAGTFRGTAFEQTNYWRLVYSPTHHHFERDFAVFFETPIDSVCGLEIINLEPWDDYSPDQVFTIDCELERTGELATMEHVWSRVE